MFPEPFGLYIHVPFCAGKCPYCDFYSVPPAAETVDGYLSRTLALAEEYGGACAQAVQTVYFGGGTPSLLGAGKLTALLEGIGKHFHIAPNPEITCEVNPGTVDGTFFRELRAGGFNRISMGLQSANEDELRLLGRRHTAGEVEKAVGAARAGGFQNLSLDLMLSLPGSSEKSLLRSIDFAAELEPEHISAYLLKIEPGTPFAARNLILPDDDTAAEQYLFAVGELAKRGFAQYEISNFSRPGYESRHNLCYWRYGEYLGLGPAAHSFYEGRRFCWPRDLEGYIRGGQPLPERPGEDILTEEEALEEFAMLNLRLVRGLRLGECRERFGLAGEELFRQVYDRAEHCPAALVNLAGDSVAFTAQGFLVSNALLGQLLDIGYR